MSSLVHYLNVSMTYNYKVTYKNLSFSGVLDCKMELSRHLGYCEDRRGQRVST